MSTKKLDEIISVRKPVISDARVALELGILLAPGRVKASHRKKAPTREAKAKVDSVRTGMHD